MQAAINQSVTITLHSEGVYLAASLPKTAAERVIADGGLTVYSNGWWNRFTNKNVKVCYLNTDETINMHDNFELLNKVADSLTR